MRVKPVVRTSMLDEVRSQLLAQPEAQPALLAVDALKRLRGLHSDRLGADNLRTVQRFMKARRATMAREVLLGPLVPVAGAAPDILPAGSKAAAAGDIGTLGSIMSCGSTPDGFPMSFNRSVQAAEALLRFGRAVDERA